MSFFAIRGLEITPLIKDTLLKADDEDAREAHGFSFEYIYQNLCTCFRKVFYYKKQEEFNSLAVEIFGIRKAVLLPHRSATASGRELHLKIHFPFNQVRP